MIEIEKREMHLVDLDPGDCRGKSLDRHVMFIFLCFGPRHEISFVLLTTFWSKVWTKFQILVALTRASVWLIDYWAQLVFLCEPNHSDSIVTAFRCDKITATFRNWREQSSGQKQWREESLWPASQWAGTSHPHKRWTRIPVRFP